MRRGRPSLRGRARCGARGASCRITPAPGARQAEAALANGAKVLVLDAVDGVAPAAIAEESSPP